MSRRARVAVAALAAAAAAALSSGCERAPAPGSGRPGAAQAAPRYDVAEALARFDRDVVAQIGRIPERDRFPMEVEILRRGTALNAPAGDAELAALAQRIGKPLPPSYRDFLRASDGMLYVGWLNSVTLLPAAGVTRIDAANYPGLGVWLAMADAAIPLDPAAGGPLPGAALAGAWMISSVEDGDVYLVFPHLATADGEWPVWFLGPKNPGAIGYPSFGAMLARERAPILAGLARRAR